MVQEEKMQTKRAILKDHSFCAVIAARRGRKEVSNPTAPVIRDFIDFFIAKY